MKTTLNINPNFQVDYYTTDPNLHIDGNELSMKRLERLLMSRFFDTSGKSIKKTMGRLSIYESKLLNIVLTHYPDIGLSFRIFLETLTFEENFSIRMNPNSRNMQTIFEPGKPYNLTDLKSQVERLQNAKFLCAAIPPHSYISCVQKEGEKRYKNIQDGERLFAWCGLTKDISRILYSRKVN